MSLSERKGRPQETFILLLTMLLEEYDIEIRNNPPEEVAVQVDDQDTKCGIFQAEEVYPFAYLCNLT
jgi:hypothetical protein